MARQVRRGRTVGQRGFTLIEIMVVITLLGLIAAAVAVNVMGTRDTANAGVVRMDFKAISDALEVYRLKHGKLPDSLEALVADRELKALPRDPWRAAYLYERVGAGDGYRLATLGADGAPGGTGANADLHSDDPDDAAPPSK